MLNLLLVLTGFPKSYSLLFVCQGLEGNEEDAAIGMMSDNTARLTSAVRYQTFIDQYYLILLYIFLCNIYPQKNRMNDTN